jgi:hypothetical protein
MSGVNASKTAETEPKTHKAPAAERPRQPTLAGPQADILALQDAAGNQAVENLLRSGSVQAKLIISEPGDKYEQQADRVAKRVMETTDHTSPQHLDDMGKEKGIRALSIRGRTAAFTSNYAGDVPDSVSKVIESTRGQPLDTSTRDFMESRFSGYDFSQIRIHTDGLAAKSAQELGAHAYTAGRDIVFGDGQYKPNNQGRLLLAHELTHVVQQTSEQEAPSVLRDSQGKPYKRPPWTPVLLGKWLKEDLRALSREVDEAEKRAPLYARWGATREHIAKSAGIGKRIKGAKGRYSIGSQLLRLWDAGYQSPQDTGSVAYYVFRNLDDLPPKTLLLEAGEIYARKGEKIFRKEIGEHKGEEGTKDPYKEFIYNPDPRDVEYANRLEREIVWEKGEKDDLTDYDGQEEVGEIDEPTETPKQEEVKEPEEPAQQPIPKKKRRRRRRKRRARQKRIRARERRERTRAAVSKPIIKIVGIPPFDEATVVEIINGILMRFGISDRISDLLSPVEFSTKENTGHSGFRQGSNRTAIGTTKGAVIGTPARVSIRTVLDVSGFHRITFTGCDRLGNSSRGIFLYDPEHDRWRNV